SGTDAPKISKGDQYTRSQVLSQSSQTADRSDGRIGNLRLSWRAGRQPGSLSSASRHYGMREFHVCWWLRPGPGEYVQVQDPRDQRGRSHLAAAAQSHGESQPRRGRDSEGTTRRILSISGSVDRNGRA